MAADSQRRFPMRNHEDNSIFGNVFFQFRDNLALRRLVQRRRKFVEDQEIGVLIQRAGQRDPLFFAAGKILTHVVDPENLRISVLKPVQLNVPQDAPEFIRFVIVKRNVFFQRSLKNKRRLVDSRRASDKTNRG